MSHLEAIHKEIQTSAYPMQQLLERVERYPDRYQETLNQCAAAVTANLYNLANPYHSHRHHALVMFHAWRMSRAYKVNALPVLMIAAAIHDYDYASPANSAAPCPELASFTKAYEDGLFDKLSAEDTQGVKKIVLATIIGERAKMRSLGSHAPILSRIISDADLTESLYAGLDNHLTQTNLLKLEVGDLSEQSVCHFTQEIGGPPLLPLEDSFSQAEISYQEILTHYQAKGAGRDC